MTATEGFAPAKVNLCLHLTGLRDDGYHLLESLVVFADVGDRLTATLADELSLTVDGPFANGVPVDGANLVLKAARLLRRLRGVDTGAALHLTKHLPHGGGIGGGSSDAACAIRLLARLWEVAPLTTEEALPLGADIPVCLCAPRATEMRGIGEVLAPARFQPGGWLVLVNPGVAVPTGRVFAHYDRLYQFSAPGIADLGSVHDHDQFQAWLAGQRNDLTKVACETALAPVIGRVIDALQAHTATADMSGSGSTCWALFADEQAARRCAEQVGQMNPDWWVVPARILP